MGFEEPTPIQQKSVPLALEGKDLIGQAQTGTGKTAAFGLPMLNGLDPEIKSIQGLVVAPTRELAIQVQEEIFRIGKEMRARVYVVYGGSPIGKQIERIKRNQPQIIVGTPGRLLDLMNRKVLKIDQLKTLVLDEADEMLNMGFIEDIKSIVQATPASRQTLMFSATMPPAIKNLGRQFLKDPTHVKVEAKYNTSDLIEQYFVKCRDDERLPPVPECQLRDMPRRLHAVRPGVLQSAIQLDERARQHRRPSRELLLELRLGRGCGRSRQRPGACKQQARNLCCLLMLANGTPMFLAGDEFLHTQSGNNNPYNQDNETTWLNWDRLETNRDIFRFFRLIIAIRKAHPTFARSRFWRDDVKWYSAAGPVDMSYESRHLAFYLDGASQRDADFYVMINAHWRDCRFEVREFQPRRWPPGGRHGQEQPPGYPRIRQGTAHLRPALHRSSSVHCRVDAPEVGSTVSDRRHMRTAPHELVSWVAATSRQLLPAAPRAPRPHELVSWVAQVCAATARPGRPRRPPRARLVGRASLSSYSRAADVTARRSPPPPAARARVPRWPSVGLRRAARVRPVWEPGGAARR